MEVLQIFNKNKLSTLGMAAQGTLELHGILDTNHESSLEGLGTPYLKL
jgi:hypothetical protein